MIATPAYGEIFYAPYVQSVLALVRLAHKDKWDFMFESISYAEVSEARNYLRHAVHRQDRRDASAVRRRRHGISGEADAGHAGNRKPVVGVVAPKRQIDLKRLAELARSEADTGPRRRKGP